MKVTCADTQDFQHLLWVFVQVLTVFPVYEDDGDDYSIHCIRQRLQPLADKLLQLGTADLRGLKLNADILSCPKVLSQLPLRHLELEIGQRSLAQVGKITAALGRCSDLECLSILRPESEKYSVYPKVLPNLCLHKAANLKRVHLQAWFPKRQTLPPDCVVRIDLDNHPDCWDQVWQSEDGREVMTCIPAMCLSFYISQRKPWPSHIQDFTALQYLELNYPPGLTDLALLGNVPHVRLQLAPWQKTLSHTTGSWQGLEIDTNDSFEISFADIDAFVRDNRNYLFTTGKTTKAWRSMHTALHAATCLKRQAACGVLFQ